MATLLKCAEGHEWEVAAEDGAATSDWPPRCPLCGAPALSPVEAPLAAPVTCPAAAPVASEQPTLPPRSSTGESATPSEIPRAGPVAVEAAVSAEVLPRVPGFDILAELGRGGMGVVYKANQSRLDRLVAIKILPAEAARDPAFAERFTREAKSLARLNHPSIITIYDFGQANDQAYIVMEFVQGANLRQRMRSGRMPPEEVYRLVGQICDALEYAHERGIVHRDIKPENILLDQRGRVKIADFGIAKLLTGEKRTDYTLTGPWQMVGTFHYMAPEQIDNPLGLDHRADIYSLVGVLVYELLTGQRPVGRFEPPSHLAAVDPRVDAIVLKALEREPARRFGSAAELKAALEPIGGPAPPRLRAKEEATAPLAVSVRSDTSSTVPFHHEEGLATAEPNPVWQNVQWLAAGVLILGMLALFGGIYLLPADVRVNSFLAATGIAVVLFLVAKVAASGPRVLQRLLGSGAGWTLVLSLLGVVICVLPGAPWALLSMVVNERRATTHVWGAGVYGYEGVFGLWPAGIFAAVFWVFLLSESTHVARWWQPALVLLASVGILLILFHCLSGAGGRGGDGIMSLVGPITKDNSSSHYLTVFPQFDGGPSFVINIPKGAAEKIGGNMPIEIEIGRETPGSGPGMLPGARTVRLWPNADNNLLRERLQKGGLPELQASAGPGLWATGVMALCLFLAGTLQLRGVMRQRRQAGAKVGS